MLKYRLNLFFDQALLPSGWARNVRVCVDGGVIAAIDENAVLAAEDEHFDCVLPGLPNLHSHAFQRGMAGLAEIRGPKADSFWTWREIMYHFVGKLTPDQLRDIAALAFMEMLEAGFTRVGEFHYLHHDTDGRPFADPSEMSKAIISAAEQVGIGLTLLPVFYAHSGFGGADPTIGQRRFLHDLDGFSNLLDRLKPALSNLDGGILGIAPHSLRAVTPEELNQLITLSESSPFHIHIAEQTAEVDACVEWSGQRPVEWLLNHADVRANWCLVHATHMTSAETQTLAKTQAIAGICPITEANLGDGFFPAPEYLEAGGAFGVGSDSNVRIDASEELRLFEYGQRLLHRERNVLASTECASTGSRLYRSASVGGGQALGQKAGIEVGHPADFISLDMSNASLAGKVGDQITDAYVFAAGRTAIDTVWRHGRCEVKSGRHRQRERIVKSYAQTMQAILS